MGKKLSVVHGNHPKENDSKNKAELIKGWWKDDGRFNKKSL